MAKKEEKKELFTKGKTVILAYDQGFEHGPTDFNIDNVNPEYICRIAVKGGFNAFAAQAGIFRLYGDQLKGIPWIIKLNAKTAFDHGDPVSLQHTSVAYAAKMGAAAVGYTIYLGSSHEQEMFKEFGKICEEAHDLGIQVVCWMYPRGSSVHDELATDIIAYGCRVAMELGADVIKLKYNGDIKGLEWIVRSAGRAKVVIAGGSKLDDISFLKMAEDALKAGVSGFAVGRNVWQSSNPYIIAEALKSIVFSNRTAEDALGKAQAAKRKV